MNTIFPGAAGDHVAAEFARQNELGAEIHLDDSVPILIGVFGGGRAQNGAAVVDQDIDRRALAFDPGDELVERGTISEIAGESPEAPAALLDGALHFAGGIFE